MAQTPGATHQYHLAIKPGQIEKLNLGLFEHEDLVPDLTVTYEPENKEAVSFIEARVPHSDTAFQLVYHFQNYGSTETQVTVKEAPQG
jgi:hypothetical protein